MASDDGATVVLPAMLRASRGAYARSIRRHLVASGFDDVPPDGAFVLGGMANQAAPLPGLLRELGIGEEAATRLVDALLVRGYLERAPEIGLTGRGRAAAAEVRAGVVAVDEELAGMITPAELAGLRAGLVALCDIRDRLEAE